MKRAIMWLTIGTLVLFVGGMGTVSAQAYENNNAWYDSMSNWMAGHMERYGYGPGACWGGYGANYADTTAQEITVSTVDEAYTIAQNEISADVTTDNINQMGRWWVVYYTDDNGKVKQGRIDSFTGEVIKDFSTTSGNYYQSGTYGSGYRGKMGSGMMYGY
ncbi:hypothetical protein [Methanolobus sp.]|jgi:hypothetical protein|uniref:hypothetical protein n=1 Tax=Methanolobus sp. TaxID=1874737 RepID=UPI0025F8EA9D|nr:hypothetical protein [Methanolobus sp.]